MTEPRAAGRTWGLSGGLVVALGMAAGNGMGYLLNLVASRRLGPAGYGIVAALLGLVLIGNVVALGLQAVVARRSVVSAGAEPVTAFANRLALRSAAAVLALSLVGIPFVTRLLHLDSPAAVAWLAVTLAPLTVIGGQLGLLQGRERFHALAVLYVVAAVGKVGGGLVGVLATGTPSGTMAGTALGSLAAAGCGAVIVRRALHTEVRAHRLPPGVGREVLHATYALGALFALSNVDVVLARHYLPAAEAGLYGVGAVVAKGAFWLPAFVPVIALPALADPARRRAAIGRACALMVACGVVVVGVTAVAGQLVLRMVGGTAYVGLAGEVWLFAATGSLLALGQLLLYSRLATEDARVLGPMWGLVAGEILVIATARHGSPTEIVTTALGAAFLLTVLGGLAEAQEHGRLQRRAHRAPVPTGGEDDG